MAFEIKPGRYFVGFWYFDFPEKAEGFEKMGPFGKGRNFNLLLWREGDDDGGEASVEWTLQYRFRYYRDERLHDNQDEFSWNSGTVRGTRAVIEEITGEFVKTAALTVGEIYDFWPINGNSDEFFRRAQNSPPYWMHMDPRGPIPVEKSFPGASVR